MSTVTTALSKRASLPGLAVLLVFAGPLAAQNLECNDGLPPRVHIGVGVYQCVGGDCRLWGGQGLSSEGSTGVIGAGESYWGDRWEEVIRSFEFTVQPGLWNIDPFGPSAGRIEEGDVLVAVEGLPVTTTRAGQRLGDPRAGQPLRLTVERRGTTRHVEVVPAPTCAPLTLVIGSSPDSLSRGPRVTTRGALEPRTSDPGTPLGLGIRVECSRCRPSTNETDVPLVWLFSAHPDVVGVERRSAADVAGVRVGDRLTHVNGVDLLTREGSRELARISEGTVVELGVLRDGRPLRIRVEAREETQR